MLVKSLSHRNQVQLGFGLHGAEGTNQACNLRYAAIPFTNPFPENCSRSRNTTPTCLSPVAQHSRSILLRVSSKPSDSERRTRRKRSGLLSLTLRGKGRAMSCVSRDFSLHCGDWLEIREGMMGANSGRLRSVVQNMFSSFPTGASMRILGTSMARKSTDVDGNSRKE